jgi:GDP-4-dehydro-6-deoxy-D-mannose reductase
VTVLITGSGGFLGRYVVEALRAKLPGSVLYGLDLPGVQQPEGLDATYECDLADIESVRGVLDGVVPKFVLHLAGLIRSQDRQALWNANVEGTENLLSGLRALPERIVVASSSAVYGAPKHLPVSESHATSPTTLYGESMLAREEAARRFARNGTTVVNLRLFNLCGPGQAPSMMVSAFARQIALIECGLQEPTITVGRLDTRRELIDVRDVATAVVAAVTNSSGELVQTINVCNGQSRKGKDVLQKLLAMASRRPDVKEMVQEGRSNDVLDIRGDPTTILRTLGWAPRIAVEDTLRDVLDDWRSRVSVQGE